MMQRSVHESYIDNGSRLQSFRSNIQQLESIPQNTLDEPIWMTLFSQLRLICQKLRHVLIPNADESHRRCIRQLDLWGPFLMCMILGLLLDNSNQFLVLLLIVFAGAVVVTFNSRVLGAKVSFLQNVSMLGYCLFPVFLAILLLRLLKVLKLKSTLLTLIVISLASLWSIFAARAYMGMTIPPEKKFISLYPVFLFYIFIGSFALFI